ncbi:DsbA family oxidoreductase [Promicromonospora vindobonensis]|uniref:DsbA family oxidoreductase n=1 Tax=Promicromonospora vindobonensis TaxID=195748 RepID=A0ABW5VN18_9MICO
MAGEGFGPAAGQLVVDVWSDVVCPFCYMGDTLLDQALEQFPHAAHVKVRYHSFLLMPEMAEGDAPISPADHIATKHGMSRAQAVKVLEGVSQRAAQLGLEYRLDRAQGVSTRTAHQLSHFAATHGKQREMVRRMFRAYFTEGVLLSDHQVLADLAAEVGLDRAEARAALASGEFADAVEADLRQAREYGISGVPFFVFAGTYAVSGAQPVEALLQVLDKSWNETSGAATGAWPALPVSAKARSATDSGVGRA